MFNNFFKDKVVLVTGFAGFKGSWLSLWLNLLGAHVVGYSLIPKQDHLLSSVLGLDELLDDYAIADINDYEKLYKCFSKWNPEIVFHLAAQPLVRYSYRNPIETYKTNVLGTLNIFEAARQTASVNVVINVTTDKCYENNETSHSYLEEDRLGGYDLYSSSKACSEILTSSYRNSFLLNAGFALASARAGNVIGGGDWSEDRLIPDCIRSLVNQKPIILRNPNSTRPWQFVLEPLSGYLTLAEKIYNNRSLFSQAYNFGPETGVTHTVLDVVENVRKGWGCGEIDIQHDNCFHEANLLQLDTTRAKHELGIVPVYSMQEAVAETVSWYKSFYTGRKDMLALSKKQIHNFASKAKENSIKWGM